MVTFLAGGTGTPKLLSGVPEEHPTIIANTGDDIEIGGHLVCPDLDTVLYLGGGILDTQTWWGISDDGTGTHDHLLEIADRLDQGTGANPLPEAAQTTGRDIARWRRFSGIGEFMMIGEYDRAVHITRTSLIDEGYSLTTTTRLLADAFDVQWELLPMSDDPVASYVQTPDGEMHFQEFWVERKGKPAVTGIEYRGASTATPTSAVIDALADPVVIGPSNPVTSIGPILALDGIRDALEKTPVVAVSPFVNDTVFSGPAGKLMTGTGYEASTAGVAAAYPFVDAFVLDDADRTTLDRPIIRTDTKLAGEQDARRVYNACKQALAEVI